MPSGSDGNNFQIWLFVYFCTSTYVLHLKKIHFLLTVILFWFNFFWQFFEISLAKFSCCCCCWDVQNTIKHARVNLSCRHKRVWMVPLEAYQKLAFSLQKGEKQITWNFLCREIYSKRWKQTLRQIKLYL